MRSSRLCDGDEERVSVEKRKYKKENHGGLAIEVSSLLTCSKPRHKCTPSVSQPP
jgi:hypothetical protein